MNNHLHRFRFSWNFCAGSYTNSRSHFSPALLFLFFLVLSLVCSHLLPGTVKRHRPLVSSPPFSSRSRSEISATASSLLSMGNGWYFLPIPPLFVGPSLQVHPLPHHSWKSPGTIKSRWRASRSITASKDDFGRMCRLPCVSSCSFCLEALGAGQGWLPLL